MALLDLFDRLLGKIRRIPVFIVQVHVLNPTSRKELIFHFFVLLEFAGLAARTTGDSPWREVHAQADPGSVHDAYGAGEQFWRVIEVLMEINGAMLGPPRFRRVA